MNDIDCQPVAAPTTEDLLELLEAGATSALQATPETVAGQPLAVAVEELRLRVDGLEDTALLARLVQAATELRLAVAQRLYSEVSWQAVWALKDETRARLEQLVPGVGC